MQTLRGLKKMGMNLAIAVLLLNAVLLTTMFVGSTPPIEIMGFYARQIIPSMVVLMLLVLASTPRDRLLAISEGIVMLLESAAFYFGKMGGLD